MEGLLSSRDLQNIFGQHICSKLLPRDVQALGQTCTALHQLVSDFLPASTWAAVAANALPAAHPLRALPGQEVHSCLRGIARAKQVLPEPQILDLWEGEPSRASGTSKVSPDGTHVFMCKGGSISVRQLDLAANTRAITPAATLAPLDSVVDKHENTMIKVACLWSKDGAYAAIWWEQDDPTDPRANTHASPESFDVLYLYEAAIHEFREVCHAETGNIMISPLFSPSGQELLVPYKHCDDADMLDFFSIPSLQHLARVPVPTLALHSLAYHPNGHAFAAAAGDGASVYDSHSVVDNVRRFDSGGPHELAVTAFSPDGCWLGVCSKGDKGQAVYHLFDLHSDGVTKVVLSADDTQDFFPLQNLISFTSAIALHADAAFLVSIKEETLVKLLQTISGAVATEVSQDGVFGAAVVRATRFPYMEIIHHRLCIYEMATGRHLHTYQPEGWAGQEWPYTDFQLSWATSGLRLFVVVRRNKRDFSDTQAGNEVEKLFVFTFSTRA